MKRHPRYAAALLAGILLLALGIPLVRSLLAGQRSVSESVATPLTLDGVHSLLVLAPHCDDETLGAGGLIRAAVRNGIEVDVVIATNGDGYLFATLEEFHKLYPSAVDYIRMGEVRQQESLEALTLLGVPPEDVQFLSYPDRGTPALWSKNWSTSDPYKSPYIEAAQSPYPRTYDPTAVYSGEDYLADLLSILSSRRPDMVVYPHPEDVHPDHWGLSVFTRLALAEAHHRDASFHPAQLTYLVHRPDYPIVRGLRPEARLDPPPALGAIYPEWLEWSLSPDDVKAKEEAVFAYKSQLPLLRSLMESFVRSNEIFMSGSSVDLPTVIAGDSMSPSTWLASSGTPVAPVQLDPTGDVLLRRSFPGTDLSAVYAARTRSGDLWMCAQLQGTAAQEIPYSLHLKAVSESGVHVFEAHNEPKHGEPAVILTGARYCSQTTLMALGDPWAIFLEAAVESPDPYLPFDQTAWQLVYVGR